MSTKNVNSKISISFYAIVTMMYMENPCNHNFW